MATNSMNQQQPTADIKTIPCMKRKIIYKIFELYDDHAVTDVTFRVSNPIALIPAHRLVLSATSQYFRTLFNSESGSNPIIEIKDVDSDTFERLIIFCYMGEARLTKTNAYKILKTARHFQLNTIPISIIMSSARQHSSTSILKEVTYFSEVVMNKINELYEEQELTDVTFKLSNPDALVKAHRLILSAASPYFRYLFNSDRGNYPQIEILEIDSESFQQLVSACYTCSVPLRMDNVCQILDAAKKLQLKDVVDACFDYLRENLVGISLMAIQTRGSTFEKPVLRYNPREDNWEKSFNIKVSATNFGMVHLMDRVYFIGGIIKGQVNNRAVAFNIRTKARTELPTMNHSRYDLSASVLNGKVYVIGGRTENNKILQSVEMYEPYTDEWKEVGNLITPRFGAGVVAMRGKIFVMGGYNGGDLKSIECYNPNTNRWKPCKDMSVAHFMPGVAAHRGYIYVLGGWSIANHAAVERYDVNLNTWTKVCFLDVGRCGIGCVSLGNHLWAIGGAFEGEEKDCVSVYDEESDKWSSRSSLIKSGVYYCFTLNDIK